MAVASEKAGNRGGLLFIKQQSVIIIVNKILKARLSCTDLYLFRKRFSILV